MRKHVRFLTLAAVALLAVANGAAAGPGDLDPTFDINGKTETDFDSGLDNAADVLIQPNGKIVVGGTSSPSDNEGDFALARYNKDGSLDTTTDGDPGSAFSIDGKTTGPSLAGYESLNAIAIEDDNDVLATGIRTPAADPDDPRVFVSRYTPDGIIDDDAPDPWSTGSVSTNVGPHADSARAIAVQEDGKVVVGGFTAAADSVASRDFLLIRYSANGVLDSASDVDPGVEFGDGGIVEHSITNEWDEISDIVVLPSGKILAGGSVTDEDEFAFALARYNSDGTLDTTTDSTPGSAFSNDGKLFLNMSGGNDTIGSLAIQDDGKIIAVGTAGERMALARFTKNGALDTSFSGDGKAFVSFGNDGDAGRSVAIQNDGKIVISGDTEISGTNVNMAIARLTLKGKLVDSFHHDGKATANFGGYDFGISLALQDNQRPVMVGWDALVDDAQRDFLVARFQGGPFKSDITLHFDKTANRIRANGKVKPAHPDDKVIVRLFRKQGGNFHRIGTERPELNNSSEYATSFPRPDGGTCRLKAEFEGDEDHLPSSATKTFGC